MEIKIENLTKAYGDFKAVDNMNLNIADGELVGLLGPSGCGKSTTLFMLAGLNDPTSGHIYFGGKDRPCIPELCTVSAYDCCGQHHVPVN